MASGYGLPVFTEETAGGGQGRAIGTDGAADGPRETIRLKPRRIEAVDVVVEPGDEAVVIRFERYADQAAAWLAAEGDPDASVRETRDGYGVVIRAPGGVSLPGAACG